MKKWLLITSLALIQPSVHAWGNRFNTTPISPDDNHIDTHFPLNDNQGWFIEESYLIVKPFLGALEYGDLVSAKGPLDNTTFKVKVKEPEFKWNSGVRLGIGRYLPHHDKWDISLTSTYLYGDTDEHIHGNLSQPKALTPSYTAFALVSSAKTKAFWRLNYFVWDLSLGRQLLVTPQIIFHPYIGLRGTNIYDNFRSQNIGNISIIDSLGELTTFPGSAKVKIRESFWGIGPRIGTNLDYKFKGDWSFLGNIATSLVYGRYHVREKSISTAVGGGPSFPIIIKSFDHDNTLRVNLEAALGLGWEIWVRDNTVRIAPNLQFEGSLWFDMNDFFKPLASFSQNHGDLGFMGLSLNLQVDF
jgi:hypothetical protein